MRAESAKRNTVSVTEPPFEDAVAGVDEPADAFIASLPSSASQV